MNCSSVDCSGLIGIGFKLMPLCDERLVFDMFSASWMSSGTTVFDCTCAVDIRVGSPVGLIMVTGRTFRFLCFLADGYVEFSVHHGDIGLPFIVRPFVHRQVRALSSFNEVTVILPGWNSNLIYEIFVVNRSSTAHCNKQLTLARTGSRFVASSPMTSRRILADHDSAYDNVIIPTAGRLLLVHHHQNVKVEWATFIASLSYTTAIYRLTIALSANGNLCQW